MIRLRSIHGLLLGVMSDEVLGVVLGIVFGVVLGVVLGVVDCVLLNIVLVVVLISKDSSPDPDNSSNTSLIVLLTETSNSVSKITGSTTDKLIFLDGLLSLEFNFASPNRITFFKSSENRFPDRISVRGRSWRDFNPNFK